MICKFCCGAIKAEPTCDHCWERQIKGWIRRAAKALAEPDRYPPAEWIQWFIESAKLTISKDPQ